MPEAQNSARTAGGRPFPPGKSGNPGGRPKADREVRALARKHTKRAVARLAEIMESDNEKAAAFASNALLDRAWGKPPQALEHSGPDGEPLTVSIHIDLGAAK